MLVILSEAKNPACEWELSQVHGLDAFASINMTVRDTITLVAALLHRYPTMPETCCWR